MRIKAHKRSSFSHFIERGAVALLVLIAWAWIMVTVGMVFYHGYYKKHPKGPSKQSINELFIPSDSHLPKQQAVAPPSQVKPTRSVTASNGSNGYLKPFESPLLIFTCNRDNYLKQTLTDIQNNIPTDCSIGCPIVISQDGSNPKVVDVIRDFTASFKEIGIPVIRLQHRSSLRRGSNAYQALAVHYGWALKQVFAGQASPTDHSTVQPKRVVILEEDLNTAPDFFDYFKAMAPLLETDNTLLAVSAFNDNGFEANVQDPTRLLRSDFFPGLGWMLTGKLWRTELQHKWPSGYWDDWLREPAQRQDRHIIRPEISRTFHFGVEGGASVNQFGDRLSKVLLNPTPVDWSQQDISHLDMHPYNKNYLALIEASQHVSSLAEALAATKTRNARLTFADFRQFQQFAQKLGLMTDEKAGVPRTAYYGVVETRPHGNYILFLTPNMTELKAKMMATTISSQ